MFSASPATLPLALPSLPLTPLCAGPSWPLLLKVNMFSLWSQTWSSLPVTALFMSPSPRGGSSATEPTPSAEKARAAKEKLGPRLRSPSTTGMRGGHERLQPVPSSAPEGHQRGPRQEAVHCSGTRDVFKDIWSHLTLLEPTPLPPGQGTLLACPGFSGEPAFRRARLVLSPSHL